VRRIKKTGIFETEYGKIFGYIRKKREESDYSFKIKIEHRKEVFIDVAC